MEQFLRCVILGVVSGGGSAQRTLTSLMARGYHGGASNAETWVLSVDAQLYDTCQ